MERNTYIYIFIMFFTIYLLRTLPLTLIRRKIKSVFIRSFLYYVPYVTLSVMTFPAMVLAVKSQTAGIISFILGAVAAFFGAGLFPTACIASLTVYIVSLLESLL